MPTLSRNGAGLHYEETGAGDPALVFVQGLGVPRFAGQVEHLAPRHRVIVPHLPGMAGSSAPANDCTIATYADDVAWLCTELGVDRAVIAGHSMGGAIALEIAARRPELARGVVLLDPLPIAATELYRERMTGFVQALRGPGYEPALRGFASALMFRPTDDPDAMATIVDEIAAVPQPVAASTMASALAWDGEACASQVKAPVLLILAGDGIPTDLDRVRAVVPDLEIGRTVGVGHFAHVLAADQVNGMIDRFLAVSVLAMT
jgi:pimeloyl-ACP methyl ester carboxylesterase